MTVVVNNVPYSITITQNNISQTVSVNPTVTTVSILENFSLATNLLLAGDVTGGAGTFILNTTLAAVNSAPGSYTNPNITVDSKGRITNISAGRNILINTQYFSPTNSQITFVTTGFNIVLLAVYINGINYTGACTVSPIGSGTIVYNPTVGVYTIQSGDTVLIQWQ